MYCYGTPPHPSLPCDPSPIPPSCFARCASPLQVVKADDDGFIQGLHGVKLRPNPDWVNPSGDWRVGAKAAFELFPNGLKARLKEVRTSSCARCFMAGGLRGDWSFLSCSTEASTNGTVASIKRIIPSIKR
jgi:hypothetical protein